MRIGLGDRIAELPAFRSPERTWDPVSRVGSTIPANVLDNPSTCRDGLEPGYDAIPVKYQSIKQVGHNTGVIWNDPDPLANLRFAIAG